MVGFLVLIFVTMLGTALITTLYKYKAGRASIHSVIYMTGMVCSILLLCIPIFLKIMFGEILFFQSDTGKMVGVIHIGAVLFIASYPAHRYNKYLNSETTSAMLEKNQIPAFNRIAIDRLSWIWIPGVLLMVVGIIMLIQHLWEVII